jgi:hypothetical protein
MAIRWSDSIKNTGQLSLYSGRSITGSAWAVLLREAIQTFNALSRRNRLGVTLIASSDPPTDGGGANIAVEAADGSISFAYGGESRSETFDGTRMHGHTFLAQRDGGIEKAFIFLPAQPRVNTPRGVRAVGENVMKVIAVHELVHACGLENSDHALDDLFQANPQVDPGTTAAQDRVRIQHGRRTRYMPPLVLGGGTIRSIRTLWT